ncbi:hypothetical protein [Nocardia seriolae]|uniref:SnoaL-like domain-containing protein n=1 Tax=Nocardia seriolae TaxID=37332 RepID=A0ABC9YU79_9NOCA|nr:hypothetical protein [Nocardia seriolae]BEK96942.1 hypothetical protein NSER024013_48480 [Nocardia seriolae]GAM47057.1 hypothetical protein NS07_v2contig00042-0048 [Nocardia seriolae]GAP28963.1 hypothetical protein NSK11_contig00046-0048 [Nocardia seriolae]
MTNINELADRYLAMWNEPDADARRKLITELWAEDGAQILVDPPEDLRNAATDLNFPIPVLEVRGRHALERRVERAYEMFVAPGENRFVQRSPATRLLKNVVAFTWSMVTADGTAVGGGLDVLALDEDGRIRTDHQHIGVD